MAGGKKNAGAAGRQRRSTTADSATLEDQCHPRKIFIGGLASNTTTQDLRGYFGRFGSIVDAVVLRWPDGRSRGFGYVTFSDAHAASAALSGTHSVGGQEVDVKRAVPGTNKLFVGGLPQNTMAAELREHFETFGVVSDAVVMIDPATGRSRGFGFVCFAPGQEGAAAVTAALDQYKSHRIRGKWIEVKSAAPPHKFVSQDGTDTTAGLSPACTPPPCATPPSFVDPVASGSSSVPVGEFYPEAPLPKLLGPAGWAEPQKIALPPGTAAPIGSPPGLGDVVKGPHKEGFTPFDAAAWGAIPWPGQRAAAAYAQKMWPGASAPTGAGGLPLVPPPGRFEGANATPGMNAGGSDDLTSALQRSLEELVKMKMQGKDPEKVELAVA